MVFFIPGFSGNILFTSVCPSVHLSVPWIFLLHLSQELHHKGFCNLVSRSAIVWCVFRFITPQLPGWAGVSSASSGSPFHLFKKINIWKCITFATNPKLSTNSVNRQAYNCWSCLLLNYAQEMTTSGCRSSWSQKSEKNKIFQILGQNDLLYTSVPRSDSLWPKNCCGKCVH